MADWQDIDYTVLLVFPGFGSERENAESVVESALDWLNTHKDKPGFRFAQEVNAHLEITSDADEARERIEEDENLAMVFLHDLDEDVRDALVRDCQPRNIAACVTVEAQRRIGPPKEPWKIVLRPRSEEEAPAHRLVAGTLTDPVGEDEDTGGRVGEVIAVLALGVMTHHWRKMHS